ncbi:ion channel [Krasilnikovia cinnamomea]|uniref:Ion channel n=1 Tax=Krasilnikovia cinnamomea TaxID=349313 RepID=A0A4Q7ZGW4_9ACTN|nr:potassium channel family protein [Krasilnikovia cinnamomea]RZU49433.1 ion channel [Krasilnikovia cinnamomea]
MGNGTATARLPLRTPRHGYGLVLLLIVVTYVLALQADLPWVVAVVLFVQTGTVWQALRVSGARLGLRIAASVVFALALVLAVAGLFTDVDTLAGLTFLAGSALYLVAPISIVLDIGFRRGVDQQTMFGALAAYLLIGMAFGFLYACLGALQPGPLFGANGDPNMSQALFFSFVTMTTTGYGDLVPAGNPAQSIAVLEALIGQLFLVTAVAKVVENWRPRGWHRNGGSGGDPDQAAAERPAPAAGPEPAADPG